MKYCVVKNTTKVIDGSENPLEIMLQNALNTGFSALEVEILTEEEYLARVNLEPIPEQPLTDKERIVQLEQIIDTMLNGGAI